MSTVDNRYGRWIKGQVEGSWGLYEEAIFKYYIFEKTATTQ